MIGNFSQQNSVLFQSAVSYQTYRLVLKKTRFFNPSLKRRSRFVKCIRTFYEKRYRHSGYLRR